MSVVRRVDHVLLHSDAPGALFETLRDAFELPVVAPFRPQGTFASGLVSAGNVALEAVRLGPPAPDPEASARLFGIAFEPEPLDQAVAELDARGIAHSAPAPFPHDGEMRRWTNVGIQSMLPGALVFLCEYAPTFIADFPNARDELRARKGAPLGIRALRTITIEATDIAAAIARWDALLLPGISPERGTWICGDGPALRVVPGERDAIAHLTFDVRSLSDARAFLTARDMLAGDCDGELRVAPHALQGLDFRLREARP
jgi:hypothetical protein